VPVGGVTDKVDVVALPGFQDQVVDNVPVLLADNVVLFPLQREAPFELVMVGVGAGLI
jgi:hypothetical protein